MADFKIKSTAGTGNKTLIQSQDQSGSSYAIQVGDAGATTLTNATMTAGTIGSAVNLNNDSQKDAWHIFRSASQNITSAAILDFDNNVFIGSAISESAGRITVTSAGLYFVSVCLAAHDTGNTNVDFAVRIDGTIVNGTKCYVNPDSAVYYSNAVWSGPLRVGAGGVIDVYGSGYIQGHANTDAMTTFSGFRIGAKT
jgi:hypothetical protein